MYCLHFKIMVCGSVLMMRRRKYAVPSSIDSISFRAVICKLLIHKMVFYGDICVIVNLVLVVGALYEYELLNDISARVFCRNSNMTPSFSEYHDAMKVGHVTLDSPDLLNWWCSRAVMSRSIFSISVVL